MYDTCSDFGARRVVRQAAVKYCFDSGLFIAVERNTATYIFNGSSVGRVYYTKEQDFRFLFYVRKSDLFAKLVPQ